MDLNGVATIGKAITIVIVILSYTSTWIKIVDGAEFREKHFSIVFIGIHNVAIVLFLIWCWIY